MTSRDNPVHIIKTHIAWLQKLGYPVVFLHGNNEFFKNKDDWRGFTIEPSVPYSPWQNSVSEQGIRIILERTRAALYASKLPRRFWLDALIDTVNKTNHIPTSTPLFNDPKPDGDISDPDVKKSPFYIPIEAWAARSQNIAYLRPFGTPIWFHRHGTMQPTDKLDARGSQGLLLGQPATNIAEVWNHEKDRIDRVTGVRVDEGEVNLKNPELLSQHAANQPPSKPHSPTSTDTDAIMLRPTRGFAAHIPEVTSRDVPRTLNAALHRPDSQKWQKAMQREFDKLDAKDIFDLVRIDEIPKGIRIYPGKWVYDSKEDYDPNDDCSYKARWVILGNLIDRHQLDFDYCTYAPVVAASTTQLLFCLAAQYGWTIRQMDAAVAFLNGTLRDTIYMHQPKGFEKGQNLACKLKQSIYGLTPAARIWYDTLVAYLHDIGFSVSAYDAGLFIHSQRQLYLTTHVDDFKIVAPNPEDAQWAMDSLAARFEMKDVSDMKFYLVMEITFEPNGIQLNQPTYVHQLIDSFGLENAHPMRTSLDPSLKIDDAPSSAINTREYQRGTGSLQWLATKTRPDVAHAACLLAQHNSAPTPNCWTALMHVLRYLKGSPNRGLYYHRSPNSLQSAPIPIGFSDSDWAGPSTGRKSIGGFVFTCNNSPISWQAKKQTCVATSTNEAEYMAASEAAKEATWLRRLLADLRVSAEIPPITLNMDNQGAIALTSTEGTKRSKHIDVRFHHIRDLIQQGFISIKNIPSADMAADGLTKSLRFDSFNRFLHLLRIDGPKNDRN